MKNSLLVSILLLGLAPTPAARLDGEHAPFVNDFRQSEGRVRLVTLLSPT